MAVYPQAVKRLIEPGSNDPRITPRVAILHVAVSEQPSLYDYFAHRSGGIESHFYVRRDGTVEQYRLTEYQADANLAANDFAVSIETQGMGAGEWTPEQIEAIKRLLLWLNEAEGIPLRRCDGPYGSGVGYHTMWGAPSPWTPVAKSCPGPDRIKQFDRIIVPWLNSGARIANLEDDMPSADEIARAVWTYHIDQPGKSDDTIRAGDALAQAWNRAGDTRTRLGRSNTYARQLRSKVAAVRQAVDSKASPADVRALLEDLDATIELIVNDDTKE